MDHSGRNWEDQNAKKMKYVETQFIIFQREIRHHGLQWVIRKSLPKIKLYSWKAHLRKNPYLLERTESNLKMPLNRFPVQKKPHRNCLLIVNLEDTQRPIPLWSQEIRPSLELATEHGIHVQHTTSGMKLGFRMLFKACIPRLFY